MYFITTKTWGKNHICCSLDVWDSSWDQYFLGFSPSIITLKPWEESVAQTGVMVTTVRKKWVQGMQAACCVRNEDFSRDGMRVETRESNKGQGKGKATRGGQASHLGNKNCGTHPQVPTPHWHEPGEWLPPSVLHPRCLACLALPAALEVSSLDCILMAVGKLWKNGNKGFWFSKDNSCRCVENWLEGGKTGGREFNPGKKLEGPYLRQ